MYNNLKLAYITVSNKEEARAIGRSLVEHKLAACVNIIEGMESIYFWDGKLVEDSETILLAKTHHSKVEMLTNHVKKMHSYDCPCVISFSINEEGANKEYVDWLLAELNIK